MKKFLIMIAFIASAFGLSAQSVPQAQMGDFSVVGNLGYQTNYERFALGAQGRYSLTRNIRLAPDVTFFFPKNKVTGLDVNLNAHYVFYFPQDRFSVYPLAGIGMQNNFTGKQKVTADDGSQVETDSKSKTSFAFNLGGGISYYISSTNYLNAEVKFMMADEDAAVILLGYGFRF